ncbi:MAG: tRNA (guanosine(37)-N1)-methyltransferase TrmD [Clostridiales bacterium]|nr:tRNA (guanosine(37)-N1)-methyltransferase TrmD [Clostridiales bacterium]
MRIDIATLFPDMCETVLNESIIGRARKNELVTLYCHNIRDYTQDKHNRVDDTPYGGGMGMVMQADPIFRCYEAVKERSNSKPYVIYLSPQGTPLKQKKCLSLAQHQHLLLLCGHYEGVDERVLEEIVDEEISIGDYVLTGGELAALVLVDSVVRLCEGVLASPECFEEESHYNGLLEYPQYTRPEIWHEKRVPEILLSGHHANINRWRREKELERTLCKRPDMLAQCELSEADRKYLDTFQKQIPSDDQTEE